MEDYDRNPNAPRDRRADPVDPAGVPPSANQTVVRSGGTNTFVVVAILAAILVVLFLAFGGFFTGDSDTAVAPEGEDTLIVPEGDETTIAPDVEAPAETAPAAPEDGATDTAPAAPEGETTAPATDTEAPAAQ